MPDPETLAGLLSGADLVFFDLDGVLVDSNELKVDCLREGLAGFPPATVEAFLRGFRASFGRSRREHFASLYQDHLGLGGDPAGFEVFYERHAGRYAALLARRYPDAPVCAGVVELLTALADTGTRLRVATGTLGPEARRVLDTARLSGFFDGIHGGEHPKADQLATALSDTGVAPGRAILVGDSRHDRIAAHAAGIGFVHVGRHAVHQVDEVFEVDETRPMWFVADLAPTGVPRRRSPVKEHA